MRYLLEFTPALFTHVLAPIYPKKFHPKPSQITRTKNPQK